MSVKGMDDLIKHLENLAKATKELEKINGTRIYDEVEKKVKDWQKKWSNLPEAKKLGDSLLKSFKKQIEEATKKLDDSSNLEE
jgi:hypothetical protein